MRNEIERIYVDKMFKKKLELARIDSNCRSLIEYTHQLANDNNDLEELFKKKNERKRGFDFV